MTKPQSIAATNNAINRAHFETDSLTIAARKEARRMIKAATRENGTLNWSKLPNLLTVNPKVIKGEKYGYLTAIQHFAPSFMSGHNVCPFAAGCGKVCLTFSGHGQRHMLHKGKHSVHIARIARTIIFHEHRAEYTKRIRAEIAAHIRRAERQGAMPVVRLNGTSDILWEKLMPELFAEFAGVTFYDYTKIHGRDVSHIANYSLTYSAQETNLLRVMVTLKEAQQNVAIVFRLNARKKEAMPTTWRGFPVIDGDETDLRFLDPQGGYVVGLRSKGDAYRDTSGFVYDIQ